jgi:hypothetical protein
VSDKALRLSPEICKITKTSLAENEQNVLAVNANVNIYNSEEKEILIFDDGIQGNCVKKPSVNSSQNRKIRAKSL